MPIVSEPVAEVIDITVPSLDETTTDAAPRAAFDDAFDIVDLPDVGAPSAPVAVEVVDADAGTLEPPRPAGPPQLKLVAGLAAAEAPAVSDDIDVGGVTIAASLHRILVDEALQHVATLENEQSLLQFDPGAAPSPAMIRAAHTLCGIHRTAGFPVLAELAKSLELALLALEQAGAPLPGHAQPSIARGVAALRVLVGRVQALQAFDALDRDEAIEAGAELDALALERRGPGRRRRRCRDVRRARGRGRGRSRDRAGARAGRCGARRPCSRPSCRCRSRPRCWRPNPRRRSGRRSTNRTPMPELTLPPPLADPLEGVRDELLGDVLPIFLDEASALAPAAGEQVRAWRRAPQDARAPDELKRTLHTFKGSARMAGCMRLGELAHRMESRMLVGDETVAGSPALFDLLEADLDDIAFLLDELRAGRINVTLPWVERAQALDAKPEPAPVAEEDRACAAAGRDRP